MTEGVTDTQEKPEEVIRWNAAGPQSAETDGVRTKRHPLRDQIAVNKHLANKGSVTTTGLLQSCIQNARLQGEETVPRGCSPGNLPLPAFSIYPPQPSMQFL